MFVNLLIYYLIIFVNLSYLFILGQNIFPKYWNIDKFPFHFCRRHSPSSCSRSCSSSPRLKVDLKRKAAKSSHPPHENYARIATVFRWGKRPIGKCSERVAAEGVFIKLHCTDLPIYLRRLWRYSKRSLWNSRISKCVWLQTLFEGLLY